MCEAEKWTNSRHVKELEFALENDIDFGSIAVNSMKKLFCTVRYGEEDDDSGW